MALTADCHLHSSFSGDSDARMEEMVLQGIRQGLSAMCFTEHMDFEYPIPDSAGQNIFLLDTDAYLQSFAPLREKYQDKIRLLFGVELGLQPEALRYNEAYTKSYDFDFLIGSTHVCHGRDPYYPDFFEGRSAEEAVREYLEATLEDIRLFSGFDVYGHLDYVLRYAPGQDDGYSYEKYRDIFDEILRTLLEKGKGIEVNTGGLRKGLRDIHPCAGVLRRYRELGGEIVTVGSDSHDEKSIASHFQRAEGTLRACGFRYYCVFEGRAPRFLPL